MVGFFLKSNFTTWQRKDYGTIRYCWKKSISIFTYLEPYHQTSFPLLTWHMFQNIWREAWIGTSTFTEGSIRAVILNQEYMIINPVSQSDHATRPVDTCCQTCLCHFIQTRVKNCTCLMSALAVSCTHH